MCLEETYMHFCKSLKSAIDNQKIIFYFLIKFVWYEDDFLLCKGMFISFENACWNKYMYRLKWFSKNEIKEVDVSPYSMIICDINQEPIIIFKLISIWPYISLTGNMKEQHPFITSKYFLISKY